MKTKAMDELWQTLEQERGKLIGFQVELDQVDRRISEINGVLSAEGKADTNPITDGAMRLLAGEEVKPIEYSPLHDEQANLQRKRRVLKEAIRLQQDKINQAQTQFSVQAGKDMAPQYKALVKDIAAAVIALSNAVAAESQFRDQLNKQGINFGPAFGNGMTFTKVGHLDEDNSRASYYLRDVVREGWLSETEVQKMIRG